MNDINRPSANYFASLYGISGKPDLTLGIVHKNCSEI